MPEPDKFVESSENSLSVHLAGWKEDANCLTFFFMVDQRWWNFLCSRNKTFKPPDNLQTSKFPEQRERGQEEWSSVSRSAKPGADILISNLSPATWYQIKVKVSIGKNGFYGVSDNWGEVTG